MGRPLVVIESHYAPCDKYTIEDNIEYAEACCRLAFILGYHPFASHLFYPHFLNEEDPAERDTGIRMGLELVTNKVTEVWFCLRPDEVLSDGMGKALRYYRLVGHKPQLKKVRFQGDLSDIDFLMEPVY